MQNLSERFTTLSGVSKVEFEEKRSIFIGQAKRVDSEEEALNFIKSVKKEFSKVLNRLRFIAEKAVLVLAIPICLCYTI